MCIRDRYVPLKEIAARQEISEKYLENILKVLVQNGFQMCIRDRDILHIYKERAVRAQKALVRDQLAGQFVHACLLYTSGLTSNRCGATNES